MCSLTSVYTEAMCTQETLDTICGVSTVYSWTMCTFGQWIICMRDELCTMFGMSDIATVCMFRRN